MAAILGIVDLLKVLGFDDTVKSKLVRHQDARYDMAALIREGWFELYQSLQSRPVFEGCKQIVSFLGDGSGRARFHGVYQIIAESPASRSMVPVNCPYKDWERCKYFYKLDRCPQFSELEGRIVIDWPAAQLGTSGSKTSRLSKCIHKDGFWNHLQTTWTSHFHLTN